MSNKHRKKKVIVITDGDTRAAKSIEVAAARVGGCCISASQGNPTVLLPEEIVILIKQSDKEPVLVMVDDKGRPGKGSGEAVVEYLVAHPDIEVLGTVAVAANSETLNGIKVDFSIDNEGKKIDGPVDKYGRPEPLGNVYLEGDTVEILAELDIPVIVGTGDTGKMMGQDDWHIGADITTRAVREILEKSTRQGKNVGD